MEDSNAEHPCIFHWKITNPFLPWEEMEAIFYSAARTFTQWKVVIEPMGRGTNNNWIFSFSLQAELFDESDEIHTHRLQIEISINGRRFARERVPNYCFESSNRHTYRFVTFAIMRPTLQQKPILAIKVEIYLPGKSSNVRGISILEEDQMQLSEDLSRIFNDHRYSNMLLIPNDNPQPFHVHSYIMDARWNNFFQINSSFNIANDQVEIDISEGILSDILTYMYSCRLGLTWPDWRRGSNIGELFEVIFRYKLYHLYKVFVKSDSEQLRDTTKDLVTCGYRLELDDGPNLTATWQVDQHRDHLFVLQMRVFVDADEIRLSYTLKSGVRRRIHVQVNLHFLKRISRGPRETRRFLPVHNRDYDVGPHGIVASGEVTLQLHAPIYDDFNFGVPLVRRGRVIKHFLDCILYLSDGTSVMKVENILDDTLQNERERYSVLGDHMQALLSNPIESDLEIVCPNGHRYLVHKAVFATRVPRYWRVLQNVRREGDIPDEVACSLRSEAFVHVLIYIYTGKILSIPLPFIEEVYRFAQQSGFNALLNLVNRMRMG